MFSVYCNDQSIQKLKDEERERERKLKSISAHNRLRDRLAVDNRKRVMQRVKEMSMDPVPISRHEMSVRLPSFKGESFIRSKPKDSRERISDALNANTWLDTVPILLPPHEFRSRLKSKEINPDMKFKPTDRYERIAEICLHQILSQHNKHANIESVFVNKQRKAYYKTIEEVALGVEQNYHMKHQSARELVMPDQAEYEGAVTERKLVTLAKDVLEKCRLRPSKQELESVYSQKSSRLQPIQNLNSIHKESSVD